jgi:hypothetical protein
MGAAEDIQLYLSLLDDKKGGDRKLRAMLWNRYRELMEAGDPDLILACVR